jgi:hypothetical protein
MKLHQDATNSDGFQGFQAAINSIHNDPAQQACTNITIDPGTPNERKTPDSGNGDKYCRDPNTIKPGIPGHDWTNQPYVGNCFLPISCYQLVQQYGSNIHAGFVFLPADHAYGLLYIMAEKDHLRAFKYTYGNKQLIEQPTRVSQFRVPEGMPGAALAVSANGTHDGIVWVSMPAQNDATLDVHRGTFLAADANTFNVLWRDDCVQYLAKFNPPVIADGKVVVATFADPAGQALPGANCSTPDPAINGNLDYGALPNKLDVGTAWVIVYGLRPNQ